MVIPNGSNISETTELKVGSSLLLEYIFQNRAHKLVEF